MRSFSKIYLLLVILIVPSILTCTKNPVGVVQYNWYPLAVGNSWEYSRIQAFVNLESDTICPFPGPETLFSTASVQVIKKDTLLDSIPAFQLYKTIQDPSFSFTAVTYFNNLEDGLYFYAYNWPIVIPPLQISSAKSLYFKGRHFADPRELFLWLEAGKFPSSLTPDSLTYYLPPRKSIQYPLRVNSQWTYTQEGDPWRTDKKIVGFGLLTTPAGNFNCYKIQWLYDLDDDGEWDTDIEFFEFLSEIGIVKWSILVKDLIITDYCFGHPATVDILEETQLTSYVSSLPSLPIK